MSKDGKYSIGQVAKIIGIESHTVRFWTNELCQFVSPTIGSGRRRYFTTDDVEILKKIKHLISDRGIRLAMVKKMGPNATYSDNDVSFDHELVNNLLGNIEGRIQDLMKDL